MSPKIAHMFLESNSLNPFSNLIGEAVENIFRAAITLLK
jgi:hypothetical protein